MMLFKPTRLMLAAFCWQIIFAHLALCEEAAIAEIKVGSVVGTSPEQAIALRVADAYFKRINNKGGIGGRRLKLIFYDDGGDLKNTLDLTRRLVEVDKVAFLFQMMPSAERAVAPYLRFQNIPKLFDFEAIAVEHPAPDKQGEAIGKYILQRMQDPKIAIVYEDSDYGALALEGLWRGLGFEKARSLVMNMSVDSAASDSAVARAVRPNSDVLVLLGGVSFQQRSLKHLANLTWHPTPLMTSASTSVPASLVPSGARTVTSRVVRRHLSSDESGEWNSFQSNLSIEDRSSDFALDGYLQAKGLVSLLESSTHDISSKDSNSSFRPEPLHHQVLDIFRFDGDRWVLDENT